MLTHSKITIADMDVAFFFVPAYTFSAAEDKPFHYHLNYEVHHVYSGELSYTVENKTYEMHPDSILIIPPHSLHQAVCESDCVSRFSFEFAIAKNDRNTGLCRRCQRLLKDKLSEPCCLQVHIPELVELYALFQGRYDAEAQMQSVRDNLIVSYLGIVFSKILFHLVGSGNLPENFRELSEPAEIGGMSPRVTEINQYITANYNAEPSIHALAAELHLSVRQTERMLKKEMHTTFSGLLNEYRIKLACHIIRTVVVKSEHRTFEEISNQLGFENYYTFLKQFKLYTGGSPTRYKRMYSKFLESNRQNP